MTHSASQQQQQQPHQLGHQHKHHHHHLPNPHNEHATSRHGPNEDGDDVADSHEDDHGGLGADEFNAGTTPNSKELNYINGGEYVKDRNVSGGRKSGGGAKFNQENGGARREFSAGIGNNRRNVRGYRASSSMASSLAASSPSSSAHQPPGMVPSGSRSRPQRSDTNQNSDNINRNEYSAMRRQDESIKSRSFASSTPQTFSFSASSKGDGDEWRRKLQRMSKRQVAEPSSSAAAVRPTNDLSTTKSSIDTGRRFKRTADTSESRLANDISIVPDDDEDDDIDVNDDVDFAEVPSSEVRRQPFVSFLHANLPPGHPQSPSNVGQSPNSNAGHPASSASLYSQGITSQHNGHHNGGDPFDNAQPAATVIELKCLAGYDGGLPQVFILEAYDSRTKQLRLNITSVDSIAPSFRIDLAGKHTDPHYMSPAFNLGASIKERNRFSNVESSPLKAGSFLKFTLNDTER